ncbi:MAG: regulatory protein RecX [Ruminococcaceae bacterium]|nr:regulatory protein RecX [Oscillospiraceae bacterium]
MTVTIAKAEKRKSFTAVTVIMTSQSGFETRELHLPHKEWEKLCLEPPCETDTETLEHIYKCEEYFLCYEKALSILAYGDNSAASLKRKLKLKRFSDGAIVYVVDLLKKKGYINDAKLLNEKVLFFANEKLHGRRRIISELLAKGFLRHDIDAALERCEALISFEENKYKLIEKRFGRTKDFTPEEIVKIKRFLYTNGY